MPVEAQSASDAVAARAQLPEGDTDRTVLWRDTLFRRTLALVDATAALLALAIAVPLTTAESLTPWTAVVVPLVIFASKIAGLYDRDQHLLRKTTLDEVPTLINLSALFAFGVFVGDSALMNGHLNAQQGVLLMGSCFVLLLIGRTAARAIVRSLTSVERCLVLGDPWSAKRLRDKLYGASAVKAEVVGRIPLDPQDISGGDLRVLGSLETLGLAIAAHDVERVIIAPNGNDSDQILDAIRLVKSLGVKVSVVPRLLEAVGSSAAYDEIDGITVLGVRRYGLTNSSDFLKRTMDFSAAALGLFVLAPLLGGIAAAIKLTSPGPVFFRQPRIGRNGREFFIYKFRSMVDGADAAKAQLRALNETEGLFKIAEDPRVTRVGRYLRRTSLDELPQLINVLKGEMSLVGPRPLVPDEDAQIEGWQRRRLVVRPGMTGLWQIFGSARIPMHEMVKIDYMYGANWSLWLDLKILLRTLPYVLSRRGM